MHVGGGIVVEKLERREDMRKLGRTGLVIADQADEGDDTLEILVLGFISPLPKSRFR
jgi:hypothetical protein